METKDIRWEQRFASYKSALAKLCEVTDNRDKNGLSELEEEGLIQRFEYTYELSWKVLQDLLRFKGYDISGPNPVLQQSLKDGYIIDEKAWRAMKKSRETTSHTYNKGMAEEIVEDIYNVFSPLLKALVIRLDEELEN